MFSIIRIILAIALSFLIIIPIFKVKTVNNLKRIIAFAVSFVVFCTALALIPFENAIVTFSSPESAYEYFNFGCEATTVIEGKKSDFVIGKNKNESKNIVLIVPKNDNGWKLGMGIDTQFVSSKLINNAVITVYKHNKTKDHFVQVTGLNGNKLKLSDELNSKFYLDEQNNAYYAYLSNFNEHYILEIDGQQIKFF